MVLEVDQCRRPPPFPRPHPHPPPTFTPASLSPGAIARMYACRLQIASGPSANCKRVVCKLQGCRLQLARGLFSDNFCFQIQIFSFFFLFYFLMQIARFPLQIASVPFANCKRALFFVKALTRFPTHHPSKSCQGLAGVAKGRQWLPRAGRAAKVC